MRAMFTLLFDTPKVILIKDECLQNSCMLVTNDAEAVVERLYKTGFLTDHNKHLYYIDTESCIDQLGHDGWGNFTNFIRGYESIESLKKDYGV